MVSAALTLPRGCARKKFPEQNRWPAGSIAGRPKLILPFRVTRKNTYEQSESEESPEAGEILSQAHLNLLP
jgi:hypothetical protein